MRSRRALFIAPLYDGRLAPNLLGAPLVEQRLKKTLENSGGYDFRAVRGTVKRSRFQEEFSALLDTTSEILFYFYGHGIVREQSTGIFVTSDGEPYDEGVSMNEIIQRGFFGKAREAVFILDCCHAGAAMGIDTQTVSALENAIRPGRALIAGCASHQQGWVEETEGRKIGVFSWHILQGLEGKARLPGSGDVRGSSLGLYVTDEFRSWKQSPVFMHRETGDRRCVITSGFLVDVPVEAGSTSLGPTTKKATILGIPFMPSQIFVGRNAELETLKRTLVDGGHAIAVSATVEGLGGSGKPSSSFNCCEIR
jgi:hypothetical protein